MPQQFCAWPKQGMLCKHWGLFLISAMTLFFGHANAQTLQSELRVPRSNLNTQFTITGQSYLSSQQNFFRGDQVAAQNAVFALHLERRQNWGDDSSSFISADALFSSSEELGYFNPREIYYERTSASTQMYLGRKLWTWSNTESVWRRGLWQPQFEWDKIHSQAQGLTGLFWQQNFASGYRFSAFVSPLFIPTMGPNFSTEDGEFVSANPWFRPPVQDIEFLGRETPIHYGIEMPEINEIIFNPGVSLQVGRGHSRNSAHWLVSYAYKPINNMMLAAPFNLSVRPASNVETSRLDIRVQPRVDYHHLLTFEQGVRLKPQLPFLFSMTSEIPEVEKVPRTWIDQNLEPATVVDIVQAYEWPPESESPSRVYLAYTRVWGGDQESQGEMVEGLMLFERRYRYLDAARLGITQSFFRGHKRPLTATFEGTYDWMQKGGVLSSEIRWHYLPECQFMVRADLIGLVSGTKAEVDNGFIADYRANDRIEVGISYAF